MKDPAEVLEMSNDPRKINLKCPKCGRDTLEVWLDDVRLTKTADVYQVEIDNSRGICSACRYYKPDSQPPELNLRDNDSIAQYIAWYNRQDVGAISHDEMCKVRLCCFCLKDTKRATEYLAEWLYQRFKKAEADLQSYFAEAMHDPLKWQEELSRVTKCLRLVYKVERPQDIERLLKYDNGPIALISWLKSKSERDEENLSILFSGRDDDGKWSLKDPSPIGVWSDKCVDEVAIAALELEHEILEAMLFSCRTWFVNSIHHQLPEYRLYCLCELEEPEPVMTRADNWELGDSENDYLRYLLLAYMWGCNTWPCYYAIDAMSQITTSLLTSKHDNAVKVFRKQLEGLGIWLDPSPEVFLVENILEVLYQLISQGDWWDNEDVPQIPESVITLNEALLRHESLSEVHEHLVVLMEVYNARREHGSARSNTDKAGVLWRMRNEVQREPKDPVSCTEHYLEILEAPSYVVFESKNILNYILGLESSALSTFKPQHYWKLQPEVRGLGRDSAKQALQTGVDGTLRTRIFKAWPELAAPHLINRLDELKGLGHDSVIDFSVDLIKSDRVADEVEVMRVGARIGILEVQMKARLRELFKDDLNSLTSVALWGEQKHKTMRDRFSIFEDNMRARGVLHSAVDLLDFADFGDLAHITKKLTLSEESVTKAPDLFPHFLPTAHRAAELANAISVVTAFRNAWAHHHPIESPFERFEASYNFVREWVKSLKKREIDDATRA